MKCINRIDESCVLDVLQKIVGMRIYLYICTQLILNLYTKFNFAYKIHFLLSVQTTCWPLQYL